MTSRLDKTTAEAWRIGILLRNEGERNDIDNYVMVSIALVAMASRGVVLGRYPGLDYIASSLYWASCAVGGSEEFKWVFEPPALDVLR